MTRLPLLPLAALLVISPAAAQDPPPGAVACSGCHAGKGLVPALEGRSAADITAALAAYRDGSRKATVMDRIAKGFTDTESAAIAAWLSQQKPEAP